jgi:hypothetical protein
MFIQDLLLKVGVKIFNETFWKHVEILEDTSKCWPYHGRIRGRYGKFKLGRAHETGAHRMALSYTGVLIPSGMVVMHLCDNPVCCNPLHLRAGTSSENMQDMWLKGRGRGAALRSFLAKASRG